MNGVDLILIVMFAAFALRGFWRGFFRESFGILALIAGVAAALQFTATGMVLLQDNTLVPAVAQSAIAFIGVFVIVYAIVNLIGVLFDRLAGTSRLWVISRLAGTLLGIAKGAVVLAGALLFFTSFQ